MNDLLFAYLMRFEKKELIKIMWASLDSMEEYLDEPHQTKTQAIMYAIGAETVEKDGEPQWKMPSKEEVVANVEGLIQTP